MDKFYLVWVDGRPGPTLKHGTIVDAVEEAERLLRLGDNKYRDVYILEPIMRGCLPEAPVEWESI